MCLLAIKHVPLPIPPMAPSPHVVLPPPSDRELSVKIAPVQHGVILIMVEMV